MLPPVRFAEPVYLWLLLVPAGLLLGWVWQLARRRADARRYLKKRTVPVRERYAFAGEFSFWLCLIVAMGFVVLALARPQALVSVVQNAGIDFVILQDGSTSMRVADVVPDRWQRSIAWLRTFAEVLSWKQERVALALFAHRAAPQVRLTRDPNALFFFLDHLSEQSPFPLEDDTSWDTNIEEGIYWGVKMIDKDQELYGRRRNQRAFVVLSDGQAWSGEVSRSLKLARERSILVYVVGIGTTSGGVIPQPPPDARREPFERIQSVLDRQSLRAIAEAGGGRYFELGAEPDQIVALKILADAQRQAPERQRQEVFAELYWWVLASAAGLLMVGTLLLKERVRLCWQLAGGVALLILLASTQP